VFLLLSFFLSFPFSLSFLFSLFVRTLDLRCSCFVSSCFFRGAAARRRRLISAMAKDLGIAQAQPVPMARAHVPGQAPPPEGTWVAYTECAAPAAAGAAPPDAHAYYRTAGPRGTLRAALVYDGRAHPVAEVPRVVNGSQCGAWVLFRADGTCWYEYQHVLHNEDAPVLGMPSQRHRGPKPTLLDFLPARPDGAEWTPELFAAAYPGAATITRYDLDAYAAAGLVGPDGPVVTPAAIRRPVAASKVPRVDHALPPQPPPRARAPRPKPAPAAAPLRPTVGGKGPYLGASFGLATSAPAPVWTPPPAVAVAPPPAPAEPPAATAPAAAPATKRARPPAKREPKRAKDAAAAAAAAAAPPAAPAEPLVAALPPTRAMPGVVALWPDIKLPTTLVVPAMPAAPPTPAATPAQRRLFAAPSDPRPAMRAVLAEAGLDGDAVAMQHIGAALTRRLADDFPSPSLYAPIGAPLSMRERLATIGWLLAAPDEPKAGVTELARVLDELAAAYDAMAPDARRAALQLSK
jgi:hypothetical protein